MLHISKASAGSGKTFELARRYITLLLGEKDTDSPPRPDGSRPYRLRRGGKEHHRSILAITFTNKATEEMKRRIIHELAVLAGMEPGWVCPSPHEEYLTATLHCSRQSLKAAAAKALNELLHDFSHFNVSTIDAFFQGVLRTFAREANLSGDYDIELDRRNVVRAGFSDVLDDLKRLDHRESARSATMSRLINYMVRQAVAGKVSNPFNRSSGLFKNIVKLIDAMFDETFEQNADDLMAYLADESRMGALVEAIDSIREKADARAVSSAQYALDEATRTMGTTYPDHLYTHLYNALNGIATGARHIADSTFSSCFEGVIAKRNAVKKSAKLPADIVDAVNDTCAAAAAHIIDMRRRVLTLDVMARNIYVMGLIADVMQKIADYRDNHNVFLLADTNKLLQSIIGDDEVPFIYERTGTHIHHFLIDEFQDTSTMQWLNLVPLLKESAAHDHDNLIIGDVKQSIYRFRGSDPALLGKRVETTFPDNEIRGVKLSQNTNWRSRADIVRFNNTLFAAMGDELGFSSEYTNTVQQVAPKNMGSGGYVSLTPVEGTEEEYTTLTLDIMWEQMCRQLDAGYRPRDIAVLTRKRGEAAKAIALINSRKAAYAAATGRELRVISDDSLLISSSPAVKFVISILHYLTASDTVATDAKGRPRGMSQRRIAAIINRFEYLRMHNDSGATFEQLLDLAIDEATAIDEADTLREDTRRRIVSPRTVSLVTLMEGIIASALSESVRKQQSLYITVFQDTVIDYCERFGDGDLRSFLAWWDASGSQSRVTSADSEDAIRVLTIHKSKGLEYPCVHVPFVRWRPNTDNEIEWFSNEGLHIEGLTPDLLPPMLPLTPVATLENTFYAPQYAAYVRSRQFDDLNTLYVAFTRAADELIVQYAPRSATGSMVADALARAAAPGFVEGKWEELRRNDPSVTLEASDVLIPALTSTVGTPTAPRAAGKSAPTALDPDGEPLVMPTYASHDHPAIWATMTLDTDIHMPDIDKADVRGTLLHDIMARVYTRDDIPSAVAAIVRRRRLDASLAREYTRFLLDKTSRPEVRRWFEGFTRVINERPLMIDGNEESTCRPDRMVWTADGKMEIVDYKFGHETPSRYGEQLRSYMRHLRDAGIETPRAFLWYVTDDRVEEVTFAN